MAVRKAFANHAFYFVENEKLDLHEKSCSKTWGLMNRRRTQQEPAVMDDLSTGLEDPSQLSR